MKKEILFTEIQGGGKRGTIIFFRMAIAFFVLSLLVHFLTHHHNDNLVMGLLSGLVLCILITVFLNYRLVTEIRTDGIYVRFPPFSPSYERFLWSEIAEIFIREFDP